jgi:hypothetical protein
MDGFYEQFDALMALVEEAKAIEAAAAAKPAAKSEPAETASSASLSTDASPQPTQCQATTKSGRQCRNQAQEGSEFCHVHQPSKAE